MTECVEGCLTTDKYTLQVVDCHGLLSKAKPIDSRSAAEIQDKWTLPASNHVVSELECLVSQEGFTRHCRFQNERHSDWFIAIDGQIAVHTIMQAGTSQFIADKSVKVVSIG